MSCLCQIAGLTWCMFAENETEWRLLGSRVGGEIMELRLLCGHVRIGHGEGNKRAPDERRRSGIGAEKPSRRGRHALGFSIAP